MTTIQGAGTRMAFARHEADSTGSEISLMALRMWKLLGEASESTTIPVSTFVPIAVYHRNFVVEVAVFGAITAPWFLLQRRTASPEFGLAEDAVRLMADAGFLVDRAVDGQDNARILYFFHPRIVDRSGTHEGYASVEVYDDGMVFLINDRKSGLVDAWDVEANVDAVQAGVSRLVQFLES